VQGSPYWHYCGPRSLCPASVPVVIVRHVTGSPHHYREQADNFPPLSRLLVGLILPLSSYAPFGTRRCFSLFFLLSAVQRLLWIPSSWRQSLFKANVHSISPNRIIEETSLPYTIPVSSLSSHLRFFTALIHYGRSSVLRLIRTLATCSSYYLCHGDGVDMLIRHDPISVCGGYSLCAKKKIH